MSDEQTPVRVGVAGLGYWGPNLARNLAAIPGCELRWLCDSDARRASAVRPASRRACDGELSDLLEDPELDAVVLATPVPTHAELAIAGRAGGQALLRREAAGRRTRPTPNARSPRPRSAGRS